MMQRQLRSWGLYFVIATLFGMTIACGPAPRVPGELGLPVFSDESYNDTKTTDDDAADFGITFAGDPSMADRASGTTKTPGTQVSDICILRGGSCQKSCGADAIYAGGARYCARSGGVCCVKRKPQYGECRANADCKGVRCQQAGAGACTQYKGICANGRCLYQRSTVKGTCNARSGLCEAPQAQQCKSNGDCGKQSCRQAGSLCISATPQCLRGACVSRSTTIRGTCDAKRGICVVKAGTCQSDGECGQPACKQRGSLCYQLLPTCRGGRCFPQISRMEGMCNPRTNRCEAPQCASNADCGANSCKDDGSACFQLTPTCHNGTCSSTSKKMEKSRCSRSGQCIPTSPTNQCTSDADCGKGSCTQRGSLCYEQRPSCKAGQCSSTNSAPINGRCDVGSGRCLTTPPNPSSDCGMNATETEVLRLVNQERKKAGLKPLVCQTKLAAASRSWSQEQCRRGRISHDRFQERVRATGLPLRGAGENVAMGQRTAADVMRAWMNSTGHRANILNGSFTHLGVGYEACNGRPTWTQIFGRLP